MSYGLLSYSTDNIGDDIQSLAAMNFIGEDFNYFDRDFLSLATPAKKTKIILNGWFLHLKEDVLNFPPSKDFDPLFISFHCARPQMLESKKIVNYLKSHSPIGCRDYGTVELLKNKGIDCYYTGCLTLTLPKLNLPMKKEIVFVDPFGHDGKWNYYCPGDALFKIDHWNCIDPKVKECSRFLSHSFGWDFASPHMRMQIAKELLNIYARATYVVTTRIHVALPCLAMEIPVLLLTTDETEDEYRLKGVQELFNCMTLKDYLQTNKDIDHLNPLSNPSKHLELASNLRVKVANWVGQKDG